MTTIVFLFFIVGLIVGSFLNVVIYRLPLMMENNGKGISLLSPSSHCVHCKAGIKPWYNIPLIGFLLLRGKCGSCGYKIPLQYPLVELLTGLSFLFIAFKFGYSFESFALLTLTSFLIVLSTIDLKYFVLPDNLTVPLVWIGLLVNLNGTFVDIKSAVIGAVVGYVVLWLIYHIYMCIKKKEALGHGDFKLLAALGAWSGWQALPVIILISAVTGLLYGAISLLMGKGQKIAFGPCLSIAGFVVLFVEWETLLFFG